MNETTTPVTLPRPSTFSAELPGKRLAGRGQHEEEVEDSFGDRLVYWSIRMKRAFRLCMNWVQSTVCELGGGSVGQSKVEMTSDVDFDLHQPRGWHEAIAPQSQAIDLSNGTTFTFHQFTSLDNHKFMISPSTEEWISRRASGQSSSPLPRSRFAVVFVGLDGNVGD